MFDEVIKRSDFVGTNLQAGQAGDVPGPNVNLNQSQSYVNVVPEFSKQELNAVVINKHIAKEIRMEKYKVAFAIFLSLLVIIVSTFFLAMYYATPPGQVSPIGINKTALPYPVITIAGLIIPILIIIINLIHLGHLNIDIRRFKGELIMGRERIPRFLFDSYKRLIKNHLYINWLCFTLYLYAGITLGVLIGVNQIKGVDLDSTVMIFIIILCVTLVLHIFSLIFNYKRKGNIDAYYGYEIITLDQQMQLRKEANKLSMIIFFSILCVVLFVIIIPIFLIRKKQNKKVVWFA